MMSDFELPAKPLKEAGGMARRPAAAARERPEGGFAAALDGSTDARPDWRGRLAALPEPRRPEPRAAGTAKDVDASRPAGVKSTSARAKIDDRDQARLADDDGGERDNRAGEAKAPLEGEACATPETTAAAPGAHPPPDAGGGTKDEPRAPDASACAPTAQAPSPQMAAPAPAPQFQAGALAPGEGQATQAVEAKGAAIAALPMPAADTDSAADGADGPDPAGGTGTPASGAAAGSADPAPMKSPTAEMKAETVDPAAKDADGKAADAARPPGAALSGLFDSQGQQTGAPAPRGADPLPAAAQGPARLHGRADAAVPWHAVPVEIGLRALAGAQSFQIRLHPEDLGRVEVKLDFAKDGSVSAVLTADKPETLTMLQRDSRSLERAFEQAGLKSGDTAMQFSLSGDGGRGGERQNHPRQEQQGRQASASPRGGEEARPPETARFSTRYWSAGPGALNIVI